MANLSKRHVSRKKKKKKKRKNAKRNHNPEIKGKEGGRKKKKLSNSIADRLNLIRRKNRVRVNDAWLTREMKIMINTPLARNAKSTGTHSVQTFANTTLIASSQRDVVGIPYVRFSCDVRSKRKDVWENEG